MGGPTSEILPNQISEGFTVVEKKLTDVEANTKDNLPQKCR